jgi:N-acetyl-anhydromuramyl-L-alanine amidase AmpD
MQSFLDTDVPINSNDWVQILVQDSGSQHGSVESLARAARERGQESLGHHFVIGNGNGLADGELYVSYRWMQQMAGASLEGPDSAWTNSHSISICLVGNGSTGGFTDSQMQRLVALVAGLQREFGIDIDRVLMGSSVSESDSPGRLFPESIFREQLRLNG